MARFDTVEAYLGALEPPLRDVARRAHEAINRALPEASCEIRWAHPTWSLGRTPVCYLKAASRHVTFGFWRGASIDDPSGRLETTGQVMAHVKLRTPDEVDQSLIDEWCAQARDLSRT